MSERFKLLSSTGGRVDRQATLRAVFDWSWDLLSLPEKAALAQLVGVSMVDSLSSRSRQSSICQVTRTRHGQWTHCNRWCKSRLSGTCPTIDSISSSACRNIQRSTCAQRRATREADRWRCSRRKGDTARTLRAWTRRRPLPMAASNSTILSWPVAGPLARGEVDIAVRLLEGAWTGLSLRGPFRVGLELASLVQAIPAIGAAAGARVHWIAGQALESSGKHPEAYAHFEASLTRAREVGDRRCECARSVSMR